MKCNKEQKKIKQYSLSAQVDSEMKNIKGQDWFACKVYVKSFSCNEKVINRWRAFVQRR